MQGGPGPQLRPADGSMGGRPWSRQPAARPWPSLSVVDMERRLVGRGWVGIRAEAGNETGEAVWYRVVISARPDCKDM